MSFRGAADGRAPGNGVQVVDRNRAAPGSLGGRAPTAAPKYSSETRNLCPRRCEKTYDGIIIGAGHHGLILGELSRQSRARHSAGRAAADLWRRALHARSDAARLLSQPALDQSLPHQRDALVQGPRARRARHLHHAALRIRPGAPRRLGAGARPRSRGVGRQHRALLQERRADLPRLESQGREDHARDLPARALRRAAAAGTSARRCWRAPRSAANSSTWPNRQPLDVVARTVRERARAAAVPVQGVAVRHLAHRHAVEDLADGLGDPRLRPRKRLPALPGRLVQSGARADGDLHRRRRHVSSRRSTSSASSSRTARRPASSLPTAAPCARASSSPRPSTCIRPSRS